eukprot:TRINITY_DN5977_c0_g1_i1.p1 TRINITY_DN5977_c0_g1~~TRINITY_DN5977_c0_g1_i1.p1  ORF type:complete len:484 (-),score=129.00 TRINITY_DN5977_c0_g1_i1:309-1760(-)
MESEHFSCDEEDYDTFSSVSQVGGQVLYDTHYNSWGEEANDGQYAEHDADMSADFALCSKPSEDMETSSQVARSIISGLFHKITGKEDAPTQSIVENNSNVVSNTMNDSRSTRLDFEGSDCSNVEYQIGEHPDQLETSIDNPNHDTMFATSGFESDMGPANIFYQASPEPSKVKQETPSVKSLNSSKSILKTQKRPSTSTITHAERKSDVQEKISELGRSNSSFTARITDWINTVSIKERDQLDDTRSVSFQESVQCSTPVENVTMCDGSDVYSDDDDQPAGYTSPARAVANITDTPMEMVSVDGDTSLEEMRKKFQSEARTNISGSLVPSTAFTSYDQGFSNVQVSNGKELFDNGLIRHRLTGNYIKSIPFSQEASPRNYHIKVTETTEQKMQLNKDGSQVIDTTHKREQSEKSFDHDHEKNWLSFIKMFLLMACLLLLLSLVLVFILQHFQLVNVQGLNCFMEKNGFSDRFDLDKKAYIEI